MKSEERHHLEQNELAGWVMRTVGATRRYSVLIVGAIVVVAAISIFTSVYSSSSQRTEQNAWNMYFGADSPDALKSIITRYADAPTAAYARLRIADYAFREGKELLVTDQEQARRKLTEAADEYASLVDEAKDAPIVARQAALGVGLAQESMCNLPKAKEAYERVVRDFPETPFAMQASERLEAIETPQAKRFYDKLASYTPPPTSTDLPSRIPGLPGLPTGNNLFDGFPDPDKIDVPTPPSKSKDAKSKDEEPKEATPKKAKSEKAEPKDTAPKEATSKDAEPKKAEPKQQEKPEKDAEEPAKPKKAAGDSDPSADGSEVPKQPQDK